MPRSITEDPIKAYRFRIEVDGFVRAGFSSCSGLSRDTAIIGYREGGMNETEQKSGGQSSFPDVTLSRGQIAGTPGEFDMLDWDATQFDLSILGAPGEYRRDMDVVQYDNFGSETRRWRLINCIIKTMKPMSDLNAQGNENSMESLTLAYEGFYRG
jgi:phage tail-like protein